MKKYGKVLMSEVPMQTTEMLKRLCTDYRPTDSMWFSTNLLLIDFNTYT